MMKPTEWSIVFYVEDNGNSPVREFLEGLDAKTQARFLWSIEQLRLRNVQAREPLVRHLDDKIGELREESHTDIYRLLYFFLLGNRSFLSTVFRKRPRRRHVAKLSLPLNDSHVL